MRIGVLLLVVVASSVTTAQDFAINATIDGIPNVYIQGSALGQGAPGAPCSETGSVGILLLSAQWTTANLNCELGWLWEKGNRDPATRDMAIEAYREFWKRAMFRASTDQDAPLGVIDPQKPEP